VQIDSTTYDNITCPECPELMQNGDIKLHAAKDVYKRFDELERRGIADKTPGWRWCLAPRCRAGQVHEPPAQVGESVSNLGPKRRSWTKVKKSEAAHNICTCNECGAKACVDCDLPWHEGETCHDYQTRIKGEDFEKKEAASLKTIQKQCKQCPGCKKNIQRNGGCDHMRCTQCNTRFLFPMRQDVRRNQSERPWARLHVRSTRSCGSACADGSRPDGCCRRGCVWHNGWFGCFLCERKLMQGG
jgi:hypothetical protein